MGQQQQQGKEEAGMRTSFNALHVVARGWAWCLLPFLRINMGKNAIGVRGILAIIVMWIFTVCTRSPDMVPFFCVWLCAVIVQRLRTAQLTSRNVVMHSQYMGDPIVMKLMPCIKKNMTAKGVEVLLCFWAGCLLAMVSGELGGFVMIGSFALAFVSGIDDQVITNKVQAMRDAEIEQRFYADIHRGRRSDY